MNEERPEASEEKQHDKQENQAAPDEKGKEVNIMLEVSRDKLEVYVTLIPLKKSPAFSVDEIRNALSDKGITFGIKEEVLVQLEKEVKYDEKLLIASGIEPTEGKDGTINYFFKRNEPEKVNVGDKIGEIIPPEDGVDGTDVFAEKIPCPDTIKAQLPKLTNVDFSPEKKNLLVAKINGYLQIAENAVQVAPFFILEKIADEYEAYIKVKKRLNKDDFDTEDLRQFLKDHEIVYGILEDTIKDIFQKEKYDQPVLIALGKKVVNDKDGEVKLSFDTEIKPKFDEKGNVDYKELNLIQNVKKGDKLAEVTSPKKGAEGCTIFGKKISPKEGVKPAPPVGENTCPDPDNPDVLVAEIDGAAKLKGFLVQVEPVFLVKGDVDFSTGNIDFVGSVIVNGDVKSGFKIKAKVDVQVDGVVEDAVIEAGGDVLIKMGFIGREEGKIVAQGKVTATYCVSENIISEGDINIIEYIMHSNIQTKGNLFVKEKKGLIVGGECYAVKGIEANTIGNESYAATSVVAGIDKEIGERLRLKRAYLWKNAEHITEIDKVIKKIQRLRLVKKDLPPDKVELLDTMAKVRKKKLDIKDKLAAEIKELESKTHGCEEVLIKVFDTVYPGVSVTICNRHLSVNEPTKYVYYKYSEAGVIAADMEELV
jgi:uncharacterized protein (DUF342 family)